MKRGYVKDLIIGNKVDGDAFLVKKVREVKQEDVRFTLSDVTGSIEACIHESAADILKEGLVVLVSGVVITKPGTIEPMLKCKGLYAAKPSEYSIGDIQDAISPERAEELKGVVNDYISKVRHPGFHKLLKVCLTDTVLDRLALMPASLADYATYNGGALVMTASLCSMATTSMAGYLLKGNGFYVTEPSWDALITACLLSRYGVLSYYRERTDEEGNFLGYIKSDSGVDLGYHENLFFQIHSIVIKEEIELAESDLSYLFNVLACTKAVDKNCLAFKAAFNLFCECDRIDAEIANYSEEDSANTDEDVVKIETPGYFYSTRLNRYIKKPKNKEDGKEAV